VPRPPEGVPPSEVPRGGPPKVPLEVPLGRSPWGGPPGGDPPVVPNELQKELQNDFKRLQIKLGPANRRDFNEISSFSRTWLDLEPFEALLKPFLKPQATHPFDATGKIAPNWTWGVPPRSPFFDF